MSNEPSITTLAKRVTELEHRVQSLIHANARRDESPAIEYPNFDGWREEAIPTEVFSSGPTSCDPVSQLRLAPEDFYIIKGGERKDYFTWDEAMEYEEKVLKPNGWRLPTCKEWVQICANYVGEDGSDDVQRFIRELKTEMKGYTNKEGSVAAVGSTGTFWSSTSSSAPGAYYLSFDSYYLYPQRSYYKGYGRSVRCVAQ